MTLRVVTTMNDVKHKDARLRLDELLVRHGHFPSRSRARDAVLRGTVRIDGRVVSKPGHPADRHAHIVIDDPARAYVSRAALKLAAGLDHFAIDTHGMLALDVGASSGGFTQVLLERGATCVWAVDVGHGQLDASLAADPRVKNLERLNARDLTAEHLGARRPTLVVSDVSFISLRLALPPALDLAATGAACVLLVKPQFEAGRDAIGRGGLLRDPEVGRRVAEELRQWLDERPGWRSLGLHPSPIEGGDGNHEFLLGGIKDR